MVTRPAVGEAVLLGALRADDPAAVVALFEQATEKDRARLRRVVEAAVERTGTAAAAAPDPAVRTAALATFTAGKVAEESWRWWCRGDDPLADDLLVGALRPRTARFRSALAKAALGRRWPAWHFVRVLVRAGVIDPGPDDDGYIRAMASGLSGAAASPYAPLVDDPALLEREVWRLFEVPEAVGPGMQPWHDALLRLAGEGRLDRARLLDACLGGLGSEFPPGQLGWLASFWTGLAPTDDELRHRADRLAVLVASPEPAVAELAIGAAARLVDPDGADGDVVAEAAGMPAAGVDGAARLHPADAPEPAQPGPWAALAAARRLPPVDDLDELVSLFATALEGEGSADDAERALAAVVRLAGDRPPGFADLVRPVREQAAGLLEGWGARGAPIEMAKVVMAWADGRAPRGAPSAVPPEAPARLRARFGAVLGRRPAFAPPADRAVLHTPGGFLAGRVAEIVRAVVDGGPAVALAEPSHRGGRLDPDVLAARRSGRGRDGLGPYDRRQAALRVPAGHEWPPPLRLAVADQGSMGSAGASAVRFVRDTPPDGAEPDPLVAAAERYFSLTGAERFDASVFRPFWDVVSDGLGARLALATFAGRPDVPAAMAAVGLAERARLAVVHWVDPLPIIDQLVDAAVPLGGAAVALLALSLAGDAEDCAAAVNAAVAAVGDGRFDPVALARVTAALHGAGVVVLTRLGRPVADLAATGPVHLLRAQQFLLALVESVGGHAHGLDGPLEALARLSAGGIVVPGPAGRVLRSLAGRPSEAGQAAATVVANAVS